MNIKYDKVLKQLFIWLFSHFYVLTATTVHYYTDIPARRAIGGIDTTRLHTQACGEFAVARDWGCESNIAAGDAHT